MRTLIISLIAFVALESCTSKASEKKIVDSPDIIAVKTVPIQQVASGSTINLSGLLSTENEAHLSFKIPGVIENIMVEEGQAVKKGQLLASLKPTEISAQVQQVKLGLEKAERDYQRALNLYNDSVATLEQLQNAKTALEVAKQSFSQANFNQSYSRIYAPADGFVVKKIANQGEVVSTGAAVIIMNALSPSSKWVLKTGVSDREWALLETGNKASVTFDAFPGKRFDAAVSRKAMAADPVSGVFEIELQVNIKDARAAAGMFGRASVQPSHTTNGFTIPFESLIEANGKSGFVFVTDDQKTVKRIPVTIGQINESNVVISSGLENQKFLVTSGSPFLNERSTIVVKN